ncbi:hypothetical protein ACFYPX_09290 [Micromonospora zamorensis]|uniref:hypothetical protein n=1 Tax=Micromonospora zamorensis TaxID=709883 RepID=UPI0036BDFF5B
MSSEINVTYRVVRDLPAAQRATWSNLLAEFAAEVPTPEKVEVVITDEYEKVAGQYQVQEVDRANPSMTAEQYRAKKVDGARAGAMTCVLPGGKVVVVAGSGLVPAGVRGARHGLLHEAQHVRLAQRGDAAWGVHRRVPFTLPEREITFEFLWAAESAIDEYRCERTVHERGWTDPTNTVSPGNVASIVATFRAARMTWDVTGDLMGAYQAGVRLAGPHGQRPRLRRRWRRHGSDFGYRLGESACRGTDPRLARGAAGYRRGRPA